MNWRIFCYQYKQGKVSFPVVSYAVTDVKRPAPLPTDFQQNIAETTDEAITLTWTYDKPVSGFQLYRYYDFPDVSGSYRLKYVPFSTGTKNADGTYTFSCTDKGLSPYTEYLYQIQTESSYDPKVSIYSEPLSCRTKTEVGYPTITVGGLENGNLPIYPDADGKATVIVDNPDNYKGLSYQWQKLSGSDWKDISGAKGIAALDQATLSALIRSVQDGDTVSITVAPQSHSDLTSAQRTIVPASAAITEVALTVTSPDSTVRVIHDLGGTAELSLPYTLKSGETGERLTVYYLSDTGAAEKLPCTYDADAKAVTFRTDHFSTFLVVHEYSNPFTDVTLGSWYYDGVNNALANGWFSGVSATAFAPDSSITRAMPVTVLYRMSGSPKVSGTSAFVDVSSGAWYAQAMAWAAENQLVAGYENGTFRSDLAITRQQMAAILYRYHSWAGNTPVPGGSLSAYRDAADVAPWALEAMSWANTSGLIRGTGPNTLAPNGTAIRAQVAVILTGYAKQTQK